MKPENKNEEYLLKAVSRLTNLVIILVVFVALMPLIINNLDKIEQFLLIGDDKGKVSEVESKDAFGIDPDGLPVEEKEIPFWSARDIDQIKDKNQKELVKYGEQLIINTAAFLGPKGSVASLTNGLNCQNCHLDGGTKPYGNNYGAVASSYPKLRARSGQIEDIYKRVNDCMERSLNGKALSRDSKELKAMVAYIKYIGSNVKKGDLAHGSGLKELAFLDRAADPIQGKLVYDEKCASCHQAAGEGMMNMDGKTYQYPPLWGQNSYNQGAGLFRISNFAKYVKYNMPLGVNHNSAQLSDEQAWDVAAFVNSQPRPSLNISKDWPDISKKPIDHPFGPYKDAFTEKQHKFGPFKPIKEYYESNKK